MPYARRAIGDEPKSLKHDFTAYDTPGGDIHEAVQSCGAPALLRHSSSI
jgi:hypothetical protein